jgi:DNA-binding transcriptional ArsR family regulator
LTAEAIKVLAHPLRARLLGELRMNGPATATALAAGLDTNTGATSYHLRKLAAVGLVEETGEGRGRERWWRPTTHMHEWNDDVTEGDPDARASAGWLREHYVRRFVEAADRWLANHDEWPLEWRRLAGSSDFTMSLTTDELDSLMKELWAVIQRVDAEATAAAAAELTSEQAGERDGGPSARQRISVYIHDFPESERPR